MKWQSMTFLMVPSIYRQRHATLSAAKLARVLGVPVPGAHEVLAQLLRDSSVR